MTAELPRDRPLRLPALVSIPAPVIALAAAPLAV